MKINMQPYFDVTCPTPKKARFLTELAASEQMEYVQRCGSTANRPRRVYLCECGFWHMSGHLDRNRDRSPERGMCPSG